MQSHVRDFPAGRAVAKGGLDGSEKSPARAAHDTGRLCQSWKGAGFRVRHT